MRRNMVPEAEAWAQGFSYSAIPPMYYTGEQGGSNINIKTC